MRLLQRDAEWLYRWGDQWSLDDSHRTVVIPGTPVLILGVYRYDASPPWVSLESIALPLVLPETLDAPTRMSPRDVENPDHASSPMLSVYVQAPFRRRLRGSARFGTG